MFYSLIKNHPFPNGNKRIATTALLTFLHVNKFWLRCKRRELVNMAKRIAGSKSNRQNLIEKRLRLWIKGRLQKVSTETAHDFFDRSAQLLKIRRPRRRQLQLPGI